DSARNSGFCPPLSEDTMKSKAVLLGHPLHPMLIPFPFAFLTGAVLFDVGGRLGDVPSWWITGSYLSVLGIASAVIEALPGLIDYLWTVPPHSSGKSRATRHMMANLSAAGLLLVASSIAANARRRPDVVLLAREPAGP